MLPVTPCQYGFDLIPTAGTYGERTALSGLLYRV